MIDSIAVEKYGGTFFMAGLMIQFIFMLFPICQEKDLHLRKGLRMVGLPDSVYWCSWFLTHTFSFAVAAGVLIATGFAFDIKFFVKGNAGVQSVLFLLFGLAIYQLAAFASVFINSSKASINVGILFFTVGVLFAAVVGEPFVQKVIYDPDDVSPWVPTVFSFLPPFNLAKAMADISAVSVSNSTFYQWAYLTTDYVYHKRVNGTLVERHVPATVYSFYWLLINFAIFGFLAWYFDKVIPGSNGVPLPMHFPFLKSYWFGSKPGRVSVKDAQKTRIFDNEDAEKEADEAAYGEHDVRVLDISKSFPAGPFALPNKRIDALKNIFLTADSSQVVCILGHNGAGKSTLFSILTGLAKTSRGDASIMGYSVRGQIGPIRRLLGVCPQHDILWNELTAEDHFRVWFLVKGVDSKKQKDLIEESLRELDLYHVRNRPVRTYSGGMKRRLSLALAFAGDSKVVCLDEPTTGLDPITKMKMWQLIKRQKHGRVVLMTTHVYIHIMA